MQVQGCAPSFHLPAVYRCMQDAASGGGQREVDGWCWRERRASRTAYLLGSVARLHLDAVLVRAGKLRVLLLRRPRHRPPVEGDDGKGGRAVRVLVRHRAGVKIPIYFKVSYRKKIMLKMK